MRAGIGKAMAGLAVLGLFIGVAAGPAVADPGLTAYPPVDRPWSSADYRSVVEA
jgi:hypothetical protein